MLKAGLFLYVILFMLLPQAHGQSLSSTWSEAKESGGGTLAIAYSENSPFVYNTSQGKVAGIEFELLQDFVRFLDEKYSVNLKLEFEHSYNFESRYFNVCRCFYLHHEYFTND